MNIGRRGCIEGRGFWVFSKVEWVEAAPGVEWVLDLSKRSTGYTVSLNGSHENHLGGPDGKDALSVDQAGVTKIVQTTVAEDLRTSFEPNSLAELHSVTCEQFRENTSKSSEHGPSGMDDLKLTVLGEGLGIS
ncbi:hypothetical protein ZOSMA_17G00010 [Zostera marina]|uniref:Uncharacterized protein n=1 Tax=Zostera marina TaxID=29655 RepID=A0A0K9PR38_ZOSMR|nr:hypothetical protein ZOSMA_17G00010 [Zostera marina]